MQVALLSFLAIAGTAIGAPVDCPGVVVTSTLPQHTVTVTQDPQDPKTVFVTAPQTIIVSQPGHVHTVTVTHGDPQTVLQTQTIATTVNSHVTITVTDAIPVIVSQGTSGDPASSGIVPPASSIPGTSVIATASLPSFSSVIGTVTDGNSVATLTITRPSGTETDTAVNTASIPSSVALTTGNEFTSISSVSQGTQVVVTSPVAQSSSSNTFTSMPPPLTGEFTVTATNGPVTVTETLAPTSLEVVDTTLTITVPFQNATITRTLTIPSTLIDTTTTSVTRNGSTITRSSGSTIFGASTRSSARFSSGASTSAVSSTIASSSRASSTPVQSTCLRRDPSTGELVRVLVGAALDSTVEILDSAINLGLCVDIGVTILPSATSSSALTTQTACLRNVDGNLVKVVIDPLVVAANVLHLVDVNLALCADLGIGSDPSSSVTSNGSSAPVTSSGAFIVTSVSGIVTEINSLISSGFTTIQFTSSATARNCLATNTAGALVHLAGPIVDAAANLLGLAGIDLGLCVDIGIGGTASTTTATGQATQTAPPSVSVTLSASIRMPSSGLPSSTDSSSPVFTSLLSTSTSSPSTPSGRTCLAPDSTGGLVRIPLDVAAQAAADALGLIGLDLGLCANLNIVVLPTSSIPAEAIGTGQTCLRPDPLTGKLVSVTLDPVLSAAANVLGLVGLNLGLCADLNIGVLPSTSSPQSVTNIAGLPTLSASITLPAVSTNVAIISSPATSIPASSTSARTCQRTDPVTGQLISVALDPVLSAAADVLGLVGLDVGLCANLGIDVLPGSSSQGSIATDKPLSSSLVASPTTLISSGPASSTSAAGQTCLQPDPVNGQLIDVPLDLAAQAAAKVLGLVGLNLGLCANLHVAVLPTTLSSSVVNNAPAPTGRTCLKSDPVTGKLIRISLPFSANVVADLLGLVGLDLGLCANIGLGLRKRGIQAVPICQKPLFGRVLNINVNTGEIIADVSKLVHIDLGLCLDLDIAKRNNPIVYTCQKPSSHGLVDVVVNKLESTIDILLIAHINLGLCADLHILNNHLIERAAHEEQNSDRIKKLPNGAYDDPADLTKRGEHISTFNKRSPVYTCKQSISGKLVDIVVKPLTVIAQVANLAHVDLGLCADIMAGHRKRQEDYDDRVPAGGSLLDDLKETGEKAFQQAYKGIKHIAQFKLFDRRDAHGHTNAQADYLDAIYTCKLSTPNGLLDVIVNPTVLSVDLPQLAHIDLGLCADIHLK